MNTFTRAEIMEINGYLTHEYRSEREVRPDGLAACGLDAAALLSRLELLLAQR